MFGNDRTRGLLQVFFAVSSVCVPAPLFALYSLLCLLSQKQEAEEGQDWKETM